MVRVSIIGSGNVAQHLVWAFANSDAIDIVQVFSRSATTLKNIPENKITSDYQSLKEADLYLVAVSDVAVAAVSKQLPFNGRLVVHTSGSLPLEAIDPKNRRGVFYPLQTFSKNKPVDFQNIPICLETAHAGDYRLLEQTAKSLSDKVYHIDSKQRKALHVAAVFANNFTNHLYKIASDICGDNDLPFDILRPLIAETANKIKVISPSDAQTGPATRNDQNTIDRHLAFLHGEKKAQLYKILTQSIIDDGKKL